MKNFLILFLAIGFVFYSCESDQGSKQVTEESILSDEAISGFSTKLNFFGDYFVPVEQDSVRKLQRVILENYEAVEKIIDESNGDIEAVIYDVSREQGGVKFHNFNYYAPTAGGPISDIEWEFAKWKCPDGQSLVNTCYSQSCVETTLSDLSDNFSSGETITMHHSGMVGGVKICSDVK